MAYKRFHQWLLSEKADIFGFEKENKIQRKNDNDEKPIIPLASSKLIDELVRLSAINDKQPIKVYEALIQWGKGPGALRLAISPIGSYKAIIRRYVEDLQGDPVWVCKKVISFVETGNDTNEISLAHDLHKIVQEVANTPTEVVSPDCQDFEKIAVNLHEANKKNYPRYCMFPVGMMKMSENYYKSYFEYRGQGVEAPTRRRAEQFDIDVFWDKSRGLIRCWGYDINSDVKQHTWDVNPSEWDEYFVPSQDVTEICDAINTAFMTY